MTQAEFASTLIGGHPSLTPGVEGLRAYRRYPSASKDGSERLHSVPVLSPDVEAAERALAAKESATTLGDTPNVQNTELTSSFAAAEHRVV